MRNITIVTAQKVSIDYELASLRDRILAFFIDTVILFGFMIILNMLFAFASVGVGESGYMYFQYFVIIPVFLFYTLFQEVFNHGQTFGKKALGIKVIKINGEVPSLNEYIVRWGFRFVDIYFSVGVIASILVSSSDNGQRLGGILSNTTVIKTRPSIDFTLSDILKIESLKDYTPKYRSVIQLDEEEVIVIKQVLDRVKKYNNKASQEALDMLVDKLQEVLRIKKEEKSKVAFLNTIIKDYIVLTR